MVKLIDRLGKGFWIVEYKGNKYKRKVERTINGNFVKILNKRIKVN